MYDAFFGFSERPFQLTSNPRFLYLSPEHREALATLRYGLTSSLGITLLLGEAGTGKTTLLRAALDADRSPQHRHAVLNNPTLAPAEFFDILSEAFAYPHAAGSKGRFLVAFEADLRRRQAVGGLTTLVVDEAHSLTDELFEEIRLLANIETPTAKLLNLVLVGQPELAERLNHPSLRQFKQRIVLRRSLNPLDLGSTAAYIASRLSVAGAVASDVFTTDAVRAIYQASRGTPRIIGVICENALLAGFAEQKKPVDRALVVDVCRDLDLPLDGQPANGNGRPAVQADPEPVPPVTLEPPPERPRSSPWFIGRRRKASTEPAADSESPATQSPQRGRIFRF